MNPDDSNWLDFQQSAMLKDYESRLHDRTRQLSRIDTFRQWEITILAAVLSYAIAQSTTSSAAGLIGTVLFLFLLLELAARGNLVLMEDEIRKIEHLVSANQGFQETLRNYVFMATWLNRVTPRAKILAPLRSSMVLELWLWHGSLIVLFSVLLLVL